MQQLTPREAEVLSAETRQNLGHHSLFIELEPIDGAPELTFERVRELMEDRLHLLPGFRRRLRRVPLSLDRPWWLEDPDFDLDYHVRHLAVPRSGGAEALQNLIGRLHERPLDRRRPLWEMYLIERYDDDPGIFIKVHDVLIDGVTGLDVLAPLMADPSDVKPPPKVRPDVVPNDTDLLIRAGWSLARSPWRMAELAVETSRQLPLIGRFNFLGPLTPWTSPRGAVEMPGSDHQAPRTSFNRTLGSHRRVAFASLPKHEIKDLHHAHDVRFNDVVLALIAGTLRHWLVVHDELPPDPIIALTPLLIDSVDDPLGTALVPLATHRHEPLRRLQEISEAMAGLTDDIHARPVEAIRSVYAAAPAVAALASRLIIRTGAFTRLMPPFNVYVINVPGGDDQQDLAGHRVAHQYAISTLVDGTGLSISAMSSGDTVDFTFVADRELIPDLSSMAERISVELDILAGRVQP
jgi:WS/DGAT/MGAT family acyltransferase